MLVAVHRWASEVSKKPSGLLVGMCLFATAASGGAVASVASTSLAFLFLTCLFYIRQWPELWSGLARNEKLLLIGLALYAFSGLISYYNVSDEQEYVKHMGRYIRFLVIVPVYLLFARERKQWFKYLLAGAIVAGPLYLFIAFSSVLAKPNLPATGDYHWITFGDAAMLNAVFLIAVLVAWKTRAMMRVVLVISILCALYVSILSQARGAWIALPICGAMLFYLALKHDRVKVKIVLPVLFLMVVAVSLSPVKNILESRVEQAVKEVQLFASGEQIHSSIGDRLAMWHIAVDVWVEHPLIGTGLGDFDREIESRQAQGVYSSIEVFASTHNIFFQALSTTGTIGFLVLCFALFIQPFRIFYNASREKLTAASLGGMAAILAYAVFGLTESWILRAPVVAIYLIYVTTLSVTVSSESATEVNAS